MTENCYNERKSLKEDLLRVVITQLLISMALDFNFGSQLYHSL